MITMGSKPIPLPYRSWDEVSPDQLQTIESINGPSSDTNPAVAPGRKWKDKTIVGVKYGTIVAVLMLILKFFAAIGKAEHRRSRFRTDWSHSITYQTLRPLPPISYPETQPFSYSEWKSPFDRKIRFPQE